MSVLALESLISAAIKNHESQFKCGYFIDFVAAHLLIVLEMFESSIDRAHVAADARASSIGMQFYTDLKLGLKTTRSIALPLPPPHTHNVVTPRALGQRPSDTQKKTEV